VEVDAASGIELSRECLVRLLIVFGVENSEPRYRVPTNLLIVGIIFTCNAAGLTAKHGHRQVSQCESQSSRVP
jgi:hypothetical protein